MTEPRFGSIVQASGPGFEGSPDSPNPFFTAYDEGLFFKRTNLIGTGLVQVDRWPQGTLPKLGIANGVSGIFQFTAPPIPANLMGQVVNFFERIYDRQHTEAEVMLVMHEETQEWRIFVPTQLVSHGGVNYVFDPAHIQKPWRLVGSIHSHCNFGASPSSTDTGDASKFDGIHMVIGHIKDDIPQITAMASMRGKWMHYTEDELPGIFDFSEPKKHEAPDWWDRYVENTTTKEKPVGFELYKRFDKPTVVKSTEGHSPKGAPGPNHRPHGFNPDDWYYSNELGLMVHKETNRTREAGVYPKQETISYSSPYKRKYKFGTEIEASQMESAAEWFDKLSVAELMELGYDWDMTEKAWVFADGKKVNNFATRSRNVTGIEWGDEGELLPEDKPHFRREEVIDEDFWWEDAITPELKNAIFDEAFMSEADEEHAIDHPELAKTTGYWRALALHKMGAVMNVLDALGVEFNFSVATIKEAKAEKPKPKLLDAPITKNGSTITPIERKH